MGLLDGLMPEGGGGLIGLMAKNPQLVSAAISLLNRHDPSVGGNAGLGSLVQAFQKKGLGDVVASWIGSGPNQSISPGALAGVLGEDVLAQFAHKAGVPAGEASSALSALLPMLVNHVTPEGKVPEEQGLGSVLGSLLGGLG